MVLSADAKRISLLGEFGLSRAGNSLPEPPKALSRLIAYVALFGPIHRPIVAGVLWPKVDADRAQVSLRQALAQLRKLGLEDFLLVDRVQIGLHPSVVVDARHWVEQLSVQQSQSTDGAVKALSAPLLPGWNEKWVTTERSRLLELAAMGSDTLPESRDEPEVAIVPAFLQTVNYLLSTRPESGWDLLAATTDLWGAIPPRVMRPTIVKAFASIPRIETKWSEAGYQGARVFYLLGQHDTAIANYTRIATECGSVEPIHHAYGIGSAVVVLRETGRIRAALKEAEKLVQAMERHHDPLAIHAAHYLVESTLMMTGDSPEALDRCHRFTDLAVEAGLFQLAKCFWMVNIALAYEAYNLKDSAKKVNNIVRSIAYAEGDRLALLSVRLLDALLENSGSQQLKMLQSAMHAAEGAGFAHFAAVCAEHWACAAAEQGKLDEARLAQGEAARLRKRSRTVATPLERKKLLALQLD